MHLLYDHFAWLLAGPSLCILTPGCLKRSSKGETLFDFYTFTFLQMISCYLKKIHLFFITVIFLGTEASALNILNSLISNLKASYHYTWKDTLIKHLELYTPLTYSSLFSANFPPT